MASIGQELLNVPFPEMVFQLASAIAESQYKLDIFSCEVAKLMGDSDRASVELPDITDKDGNRTIKTSLIGAGFQPTFYQFSESIIEVKIAITMSKSSDTSVSSSVKAGIGCFSASVNASYSSKYSYNVEGSSLLRTKLVPAPPSPFMQSLLSMKAAMLQASVQKQVAEVEKAEKEEAAAAAAG
jgi:hypothetical protein